MLDLIFQTLQVFMVLVLVLGIVWVLGEVLRDAIRRSLRPDKAVSGPIILSDPPPPHLVSDADEAVVPPAHTLPRSTRRAYERHR